MLWAVRHKCPSGVQFTFNCYRHWDKLVVRDTGDGSGHLLHSKVGVTQGDPLAMIAYGIRVLPLIRELRGPTPVSHNRGTRMTQGKGGSLATSSRIFGTYRCEARQGATTRSRPKAFWSWPQGM